MALATFGSILAAVVVFSALKKREADVQRAMAHTAQVVVAAHAIPLGTKLQSSDVKLARWSRDSVPESVSVIPKPRSARSPKDSLRLTNQS
jgi:Flp pilus assembly protein CpaB